MTQKQSAPRALFRTAAAFGCAAVMLAAMPACSNTEADKQAKTTNNEVSNANSNVNRSVNNVDRTQDSAKRVNNLLKK